MELTGPIHDFLLVFLGLGLIVGGLGVVLLTNPIFSAFSLGLVLVCISLFHIPSNSHFVAAAQLLIYVGAINVLVQKYTLINRIAISIDCSYAAIVFWIFFWSTSCQTCTAHQTC
ncbi:hypothetical protein MKX03_033732 [Papaver bracteatum]|nr:hypothetical protein MKX03_033732 [Papaver bracteatum]